MLLCVSIVRIWCSVGTINNFGYIDIAYGIMDEMMVIIKLYWFI